MKRNIPIYQGILCIGLFIIGPSCFFVGLAFDIRYIVHLGAFFGLGGFIALFLLMIKYGSPSQKKAEPAVFPTDENRRIFLKGLHSFRSINTLKNILTGSLFAAVLFGISVISHCEKISGFFAEIFLIHIPYCLGSVSLFIGLLNIWAFVKGNIVPVEVSDTGIRNGKNWLPWQEVRKLQIERVLPWGPLRLVVYPQKGGLSFLLVDEKMSDQKVTQILIDIREYCSENNHQVVFPKKLPEKI